MVDVVQATVQDVAVVRDVLRETWYDTYGSMLPAHVIEHITSEWHAPHRLEQQVRDPNIFFAIGLSETRDIVGVVSAREEEGVVIVDRLHVRSSFQRRGIGTQLLEASYACFPVAKKARVNVEVENAGGIIFYGKTGLHRGST